MKEGTMKELKKYVGKNMYCILDADNKVYMIENFSQVMTVFGSLNHEKEVYTLLPVELAIEQLESI